MAGEHGPAKHIVMVEPFISFQNCRALVAGGLDHPMACTAVGDIVNIVVKAVVDYEGEWPTVGGINGTTCSLAELVARGEKLRG